MSLFRNHRLDIAIRILLFTFSVASLLLFFYQSIRNHNYSGGNDLTSYLNSSKWFFNGENPYTAPVRRYIYPLFLLIFSYPLSFLQSNYFQKAITAAIWSVVSYFAFFKTAFATWKHFGYSREFFTTIKQNAVKLALLVVLLHPFMQDEFLNGQVNLIVLGGIAGFFFMLERKNQVAAALFLAISASIKIAPAICLLYVLFTRQYKTIVYFIVLVILFNFVLPLAINSQSLDYYSYFVAEVMPQITGSDFEGGFKSYSIISTISYVLGIHWIPSLKIAAVGILTLALFLPVIRIVKRNGLANYKRQRLTFFALVISIIPLTFPMSESHHLLILTIPLLLVIEHWQNALKKFSTIFADRLSIWFIVSLAILHIGQVFKPTPLRLTGLVGIYLGMLVLLRQTAQIPPATKK